MQRGLLAFIARAEVPTDGAGKARWELVETLKEGRRLWGGRRTSLGFRSTTWGGRGAATFQRRLRWQGSNKSDCSPLQLGSQS